MPDIYFRADGSSTIGLGHVYRSCALAAMLRARYTCRFIIKDPVPALRAEILKHTAGIVELDAGLDLAADAKAVAALLQPGDILVLDGYVFDAAYQQYIREHSQSILVAIDDIHATRFYADAVINHIGGILPSDYDATPATQFFLGLRYALLRKEFLTAPAAATRDPEAMLICLGGSDPANDTLRILDEVLAAGFCTVHVLVGAGYRYRDELAAACLGKEAAITVHQNMDGAGVAALMQRCGYAVLSPSSISYEYMSLGGIVFLHQIADNQVRVKAYFLEQGLALDVAQLAKLPAADAEAMPARQKAFFDRQSPARLVAVFDNLVLTDKATVRRAGPGDTALTHGWANDPEARRMSFSSADIPYADHERWFAAKIADGRTIYYIFEADGVAFGQIRFEPREDGYMLSYSIDKDFRGRGLGSFILAAGIKALRAEMKEASVVFGYVKTENRPSCSSFEKLRFTRMPATQYPDSYRYHIQI